MRECERAPAQSSVRAGSVCRVAWRAAWPSSAGGVGSAACSAERKCFLLAVHFLPASLSTRRLRVHCLCVPPSQPLGIRVTLMEQAGKLWLLGSGRDLGSDLHAWVYGSDLEIVSAFRDTTPCLWECVM